MKETVSIPIPSRRSKPAVLLGIAGAAAALVFLASLLVLSPEFDPSWRMVSEYALGNYGLVLSLMFLSWAISSWGPAYALRSDLRTRSARVGLWLLVISGIGVAMASVFNITYDFEHNIASVLGFVFPILLLIMAFFSIGIVH